MNATCLLSLWALANNLAPQPLIHGGSKRNCHDGCFHDRDQCSGWSVWSNWLRNHIMLIACWGYFCTLSLEWCVAAFYHMERIHVSWLSHISVSNTCKRCRVTDLFKSTLNHWVTYDKIVIVDDIITLVFLHKIHISYSSSLIAFPSFLLLLFNPLLTNSQGWQWGCARGRWWVSRRHSS